MDGFDLVLGAEHFNESLLCIKGECFMCKITVINFQKFPCTIIFVIFANR